MGGMGFTISLLKNLFFICIHLFMWPSKGLLVCLGKTYIGNK